MQYLLPPQPGQTSVSVPGYPQVNVDSDGLFRVDNSYLADLMVDLGFRRARDSEIIAVSSARVIGEVTDTAQTPAGDEDPEDETADGDADETEEDPDDEEDEEVDDDAIDLAALTKDPLKQWLDDREIDYPKSAKLDELRDIALKAQAKILAERETEDEE